MVFTRRDNYNKHQKVHTGATKFECFQCGAGCLRYNRRDKILIDTLNIYKLISRLTSISKIYLQQPCIVQNSSTYGRVTIT